MNNYSIRVEEERDYLAVESLVRESFWNVYRPDCRQADLTAQNIMFCIIYETVLILFLNLHLSWKLTEKSSDRMYF